MISKDQLFSPIAKQYQTWNEAEEAIRDAYVKHKDLFTPDFTASDLIRWSYENNVLVRSGKPSHETRRVAIEVHASSPAAD